MAPSSLFFGAMALMRVGSSSEACDQEVEAMSALQTQHKVAMNDHAMTTSRIAQANEQAAAGAQRVCVDVAVGEEVPIAGFFSSKDKSVMDLPVQQGAKAESPGTLCVEAEALALLERALGASGAAEVENTMTNKLETALTYKEKIEDPLHAVSWDGAGKRGVDATNMKKGGGKKKEKYGKYGELPACDTLPSTLGVSVCSGTDKYGCRESDINKKCGRLSNACCNDVDGSCTDGDDAVSCVADPGVGNNDYGNLPACNTTGGGFCHGNGGVSVYDACKLELIIEWCKTTEDACCADADGDCTDGTDRVKCTWHE